MDSEFTVLLPFLRGEPELQSARPVSQDKNGTLGPKVTRSSKVSGYTFRIAPRRPVTPFEAAVEEYDRQDLDNGLFQKYGHLYFDLTQS